MDSAPMLQQGNVSEERSRLLSQQDIGEIVRMKLQVARSSILQRGLPSSRQMQPNEKAIQDNTEPLSTKSMVSEHRNEASSQREGSLSSKTPGDRQDVDSRERMEADGGRGVAYSNSSKQGPADDSSTTSFSIMTEDGKLVMSKGEINSLVRTSMQKARLQAAAIHKFVKPSEAHPASPVSRSSSAISNSGKEKKCVSSPLGSLDRKFSWTSVEESDNETDDDESSTFDARKNVDIHPPSLSKELFSPLASDYSTPSFSWAKFTGSPRGSEKEMLGLPTLGPLVGGLFKSKNEEQPRHVLEAPTDEDTVHELGDKATNKMPSSTHDSVNKEEIEGLVNGSMERAQQTAREEIKDILQKVKFSERPLDPLKGDGRRAFTQEQITKIVQESMSRARESAQKEISAQVQESYRRARESAQEEIRDLVRQSMLRAKARAQEKMRALVKESVQQWQISDNTETIHLQSHNVTTASGSHSALNSQQGNEQGLNRFTTIDVNELSQPDLAETNQEGGVSPSSVNSPLKGNGVTLMEPDENLTTNELPQRDGTDGQTLTNADGRNDDGNCNVNAGTDIDAVRAANVSDSLLASTLEGECSNRKETGQITSEPFISNEKTEQETENQDASQSSGIATEAEALDCILDEMQKKGKDEGICESGATQPGQASGNAVMPENVSEPEGYTSGPTKRLAAIPETVIKKDSTWSSDGGILSERRSFFGDIGSSRDEVPSKIGGAVDTDCRLISEKTDRGSRAKGRAQGDLSPECGPVASQFSCSGVDDNDSFDQSVPENSKRKSAWKRKQTSPRPLASPLSSMTRSETSPRGRVRRPHRRSSRKLMMKQPSVDESVESFEHAHTAVVTEEFLKTLASKKGARISTRELTALIRGANDKSPPNSLKRILSDCSSIKSIKPAPSATVTKPKKSKAAKYCFTMEEIWQEIDAMASIAEYTMRTGDWSAAFADDLTASENEDDVTERTDTDIGTDADDTDLDIAKDDGILNNYDLDHQATTTEPESRRDRKFVSAKAGHKPEQSETEGGESEDIAAAKGRVTFSFSAGKATRTPSTTEAENTGESSGDDAFGLAPLVPWVRK